MLSLGAKPFTEPFTELPSDVGTKKAARELAAYQGLNGGADETRTRDLRSDSPVC